MKTKTIIGNSMKEAKKEIASFMKSKSEPGIIIKSIQPFYRHESNEMGVTIKFEEKEVQE